jgi:hypothetical protein
VDTIRTSIYRLFIEDSASRRDDMALVFILSDFGQMFATRDRAIEIREELLKRAAAEDTSEVTIDFAGVTNVSYSFADEFLGKLCAEAAIRVHPTNLSPRVAQISSRAVERRAGFAIAG